MQQKFLIPENTALKVTDEQGIKVDEDVFPELATVKEVRFVIYTDNGKVIVNVCFIFLFCCGDALRDLYPVSERNGVNVCLIFNKTISPQ